MVESDKNWLRLMSKVRVKHPPEPTAGIVVYVPDSVHLCAGLVGWIIGKKGTLWTVAFESHLYPTPIEVGFLESQIEPYEEPKTGAMIEADKMAPDGKSCLCHDVPAADCPGAVKVPPT